MKKIIVLGSTGSVGRQALQVAKGQKIVGISGHSNLKLLEKQAKEFGCPYTLDPMELASQKCDIVVNAISGLAGLPPLLAALEAGNKVALANKESIVAAGSRLHKYRDQIIPVDSEHSSIYRCLQGREEPIRRIILTCSGGPFFGRTDLFGITPKQALAHPTWKMGKKISIDSATLMNKGFEIIEAHHLFDIPYEKIDVLIHPQSLVHGIVEFEDGSILAHASNPDMRIPIAYALGLPAPNNKLNLTSLEFFQPDHKTFKGIKLALKFQSRGESLVRANDEAVSKFLAGEISFLDIYKYIEKNA
ncbi:MAG: 1-deoxy-D-xylulose-5-phosphate reductoisomerase [Patescibacteria group bacterium]|nr:1-deoxy-D-xylulose-5-phosphate reductoisomerase [Patescibacteria group bacterium]